MMISEMSRGRRGAAGLSVAQATIGPVEDRRVVELQANVDSLILGERTYLGAGLKILVAGGDNYTISRMLRSGGGLSGDDRKGAGDLVDAALLASALEDHHQASDLLTCAGAHQARHIAYLESLSDEQRVRRGLMAGEMLASASWLSSQIPALAADAGRRRRLGQTVIMNSKATNQVGATAQASGERLLRDALVAGDLASARAVLARLFDLMPDRISEPISFDDEGWEAARRLALAQRALGDEPDDADVRNQSRKVLSGNLSAARAEVEYRRARRLAGAAHEEALSMVSRQSAAVTGTAHAPLASADHWRAKMRRAIEGRGGFAASRITAMVRSSVIEELAAHGDPVAPGLSILASADQDRSSKLVVHLIAHHDVEVDGRAVRLEAAAKIGTSQARTPRGLARMVANRTGLEVDPDAVEFDEERTFAARRLSSSDSEPLADGTPSTRKLLGRELCRHQNGIWEANHHDGALVLRCDDCQSPRVACVPFHRLPEGHELLRKINRPDYIKAERAYAALEGADPDSVPDSISALRSRDGVASLDASAYGPTTTARLPGRGVGVEALAVRRGRTER